MYIEFTGASGAGKSVLTERLVRHLRGTGRAVTNNNENTFDLAPVKSVFWQNILLDVLGLSSLLAAGIFWAEARFAWAMTRAYSHSFLYRMNATRSYLRKRGMYEYCKHRKNLGVILMDEGIVHGAHNLLVHTDMGARPSDIDAYLAHIPLPDKIVLVEAPLNILEKRILARPDQPIRSNNPQKLANYASHARALFEAMKEHPRLKPRLLVTDSSEPLEGRLTEWLDAQTNGKQA